MADCTDPADTAYDFSADEMDAEVDSDQEQDLDMLLHSWLGELESVTQSLDSDLIETQPIVSQAPAPAKDNLDFFQLSYSHLEDSQDIDLDALLGDLCEMEQSLQMDMDKQMEISDINAQNLAIHSFPPPESTTVNIFTPVDAQEIHIPPPPPPNDHIGGLDALVLDNLPPPPSDMVSTDDLTLDWPTAPELPNEIITVPTPHVKLHTELANPPTVAVEKTQHTRTAPTSNLGVQLVSSKFQPSISSLSTSSNLSPPPTNISKSVRLKLEDLELDLHNDETLSEEEKVARLKAEKVRIALEKLKEARVKKLIIKVHTEDGGSKTVFVDETMNARNIVQMMIEKNHYENGPNWALVEQLPVLYMERVLEDNENVVKEVLLNWERDTDNRILFSERRDKYALFKNPQHYLLSSNTSQIATEFAEKSKKTLIDEFFLGDANRVPELEGSLFLKSEGKKSWKKYHFVLRASGLYYSPKGKSKVSKDLVCLVQFEHIEIYSGLGWKKKYKAPTDCCFALKHPQIQQKSKYVKYICAEDYRTCQRWMTGVRLAKNGKELLKNFENSQHDSFKFSKNLDSISQSSLGGDTSSLSSDQSGNTVSSQGSASSGGSGIQSRLNRRSHMGDIFSQAWKKGKQVEETRRSSRTSMSMTMSMSVDEDNDVTVPTRPALVTPSLMKASSQVFTYDVQQELQQLELDMELDLNLGDLLPSNI